MGILRLLLALSVVIMHAVKDFPLPMVGGMVAVQTFYMISGFHMALILHEKYSGANSYRIFITNRLLRLYPTYLVVLSLIVLISVARFATAGSGGGPLSYYSEFRTQLGLVSTLILVVTNLIIVGQDVLMFFRVDTISHGLAFSGDFQAADTAGVSLHQFLFVPQAWTLGVELSFYVVAPFLVRRSLRFLVAVIAVSLGLRCVTYGMGYNMDPWTYRFFPFELAFFLTGAVGYRVYVRLRQQAWSDLAGKVAWAVALIATVAFSLVPMPDIGKQWAYYALLACAIPLIFQFTKNSRVDRWIGELSYPVYICHMLILRVIGNYVPNHYLALAACAGSIMFSILLMKFVIEPIETIRRSRAEFDQSNTVSIQG